MRILIYTGKGGVGKTSIAAATAVRIAQSGRKVLIMSTDQAHSLGDCFEQKLGDEAREVLPGLEAAEIDPGRESRRAWGNLNDYLRQIINDKANDGIAAEEALVFPGFEELCSLLRILDATQEKRYDAILVDCAPTGETLSLLRYPERLSVLADQLLPMVRSFNNALGGLVSRATTVPKPRDIVFAEFDRLVKRLNSLQAILRDRSVSSMRIVMTPERIVLEEARRSYTWISQFDFGVDAVYVNKIYPKEALEGYFSGWMENQERSLELARESFRQQKIFELPLQEEEIRGIEALGRAADVLYGEAGSAAAGAVNTVGTEAGGTADGGAANESAKGTGLSEDPLTIFCEEQSFRMEEEKGTKIFIVRLPYANKDDISVEKEGSDLLLTVGNELRRFRLPDNVERRYISSWEFSDGELRIRLDYD